MPTQNIDPRKLPHGSRRSGGRGKGTPDEPTLTFNSYLKQPPAKHPFMTNLMMTRVTIIQILFFLENRKPPLRDERDHRDFFPDKL
jgi:hypothetical protein